MTFKLKSPKLRINEIVNDYNYTSIQIKEIKYYNGSYGDSHRESLPK